LFPNERPLRHPAEVLLNEIERAVLQYVKTTPVMPESIVLQSGLKGQQVITALSVLEKKMIIRLTADGQFVLI
jgi:hypothetical protein